MTIIREEVMLAALHELDSERWEEVLDFIGYLRQRTSSGVETTVQHDKEKILTGRQLAQSSLVGLWSDRKDLPDSPDYARQLRRQAEQRTYE